MGSFEPIHDINSFIEGINTTGEYKGVLRVHKFLGDARAPFPRLQDHVLCFVQRVEVPKNLSIIVTVINSDVTCQDCLELLHS